MKPKIITALNLNVEEGVRWEEALQDVTGRCNAGMRAVLVDSRRTPSAAAELLADGTFVISRLGQFAQVVT
ncbi:hypothetical protein ABZ682_18855 [Streptomyces griseoviridis]|uniref:hypothetical protein n=1 Tax=Streptomyces griseoviridis TaxID=45398 RepID=UPI0033CDA3EA